MRHIHKRTMARTLAISDDVYEMVSKVKMKGESFSDVIRRLLKRQKISDIPKIFDESEWEKVEKAFGRQKMWINRWHRRVYQ